ncbi:MAG: FAD-binding and (Fe-S)-binding domain-containing protein [Corynebacterium sp.]|uniref:FAD-binding and (Fe-S)-binding domain-containing protein n=1 Tax=Corynebacterium sp. TaxID=1720 RepID=UPI0026DF5A61|nr:FAD-binding and (Fe-S)-binding domain-containing protein [Corynebacterium sp.]MDO5670239.1 FAD-binding and (Fe-S)-binding domain-containing protein [Corynebacterium sp.]
MRLRTDMMTRAAYSSDASIFRRVPAAVAEPASIDEVRAALEHARTMGWPVVGRGGGTSVAGNAIGEGLIIDTSRHFHRILSIDPQQRTATVEPGVICDDLRAAAAEYGLTFGPDPSTHSRATIGGMIANNACGSHSVAYGTTADNLVSVTMMLAGGRLVTINEHGCDDPEIDAALRRLAEEHGDLIDNELGHFSRQTSGYGLHHLATNPVKAIAGSEGTLGIITQATVRLVELPPAKALAVLAFDTVFDAAQAGAQLRTHPGIATIEGMGGDLVDALGTNPDLPGANAGGWLFCEVTAATTAEAEARAAGIAHGVDKRIVTDPEQMRALWRIREAAAGIVTRLPDGGEAWPNWEDSAVPPENLAAYLRELYDLMAFHELRGIPFGHFGEGCVHVRISFDFESEEGLRTFRRFMRDAARLVTDYGGSLSGEHGDGRARSSLLRHMYSPALRDVFEQFKLIFDPERVLNPGVLVWAEDFGEGLRMGRAQRRLEVTPVHALERDRGSLVNAINRCVGVGSCRSHTGAMCPSFQVTGDEVHSTRGRARLLSEAMRGETLDGFHSQEVAEALDLCLSCKACASECPVSVDMATYKAEFLHEHHRGLRPRAHYTLGWLPVLLRVPRWLAGIVLRLPGMARVLGLDPARPLPRLRGGRLRAGGAGEPVVLWPDTFSRMDATAAQAAVEVLERLGYRVEIPTGFVCCGLTWHSTGQLGMVRRVLHRTARVMRPYLDRGLPVVAVEPSCSAMLIDAPSLTNDPDVARLAAATVSWAQFVGPKLAELGVSADGIQALTQVHCHERAVGAPKHAAAILRALGVEEEQIATGCCGLAGNWGFEPGHGEMSLELGERELFPRVRAAAGEVIADGFSCRTQIEQGTGRRARHLAEVVRDALDGKVTLS